MAFEAETPHAATAAATEPRAEGIEPLEATEPAGWAVVNWHLEADLPETDLPTGSPRSPWTMPAQQPDPVTDWSRTEHADGSAAVAVKRSLNELWGSKIGAEFNLPPPSVVAPGSANPAKLLSSATADSTAGAAWASLSTPSFSWGKAGLDARLDAAASAGKASVNASHAVPLGRQFSLTLQSGYAATEMLASGTAPVEAAADSHIFSTEQVARVAILPTQTKVAAGLKTSTTDTRWLHTLSAEQTLFDGASVVGSISESVEGPPNTSVAAKFQRNW